MEGMQKCDAASDLTVTTANGVNHLFYQAETAETYEFSHFRDHLIGEIV